MCPLPALQASSGAGLGSELDFPAFESERSLCASPFYPAAKQAAPRVAAHAEQGLGVNAQPLRQLCGTSSASQSAQSKRVDSQTAGGGAGGGGASTTTTSLSMLSDTTLAGFSWEYGQHAAGVQDWGHFLRPLAVYMLK